MGDSGVPPELLAQFKETFPGQDVNQIERDLLTDKEKTSLILYATQKRGQDFFENRVVQGLAYRPKIKLTFPTKTLFMGKTFPAGTHLIASKDLFNNTKIEFSGPKGMVEYLGFEIHVRRSDGAGNNLMTSTALQKALIGKAASVHQNVVAPLAKERLAKNPTVEAFKIVEFFRRVNLYAQLLRVERGNQLTEITASSGNVDYINMPVLDKYDLELFFEFFIEAGELLQKGQDIGILAEKSGLVGMRAGAVYDGMELLWGLEFRDLGHRKSSCLTANFRSTKNRYSLF